MKILTKKFDSVIVLELKPFADDRGFFVETYRQEIWTTLGITTSFVQDNHSMSIHPGTIRGLHYQLEPKPQAKLVHVLKGSILDVFVDIRKGSTTFGKWDSVTLTEKNNQQIFIPAGFAHGFCTLEPNTHVMYKVDNPYSPAHDRNIRWNDPDLAIRWPFETPHLSDKDANAMLFKDAEINFTFKSQTA